MASFGRVLGIAVLVMLLRVYFVETDDPESFTLTLGEAVTISSPGYPGNYPNSLTKSWTFTSEGGFRVNFTHFDTESGYDFVTVSDGPNSARFTGDGDGVTGSPLLFENSMLTIELTTDISSTRSGFQAVITAFDTQNVLVCDSKIFTEEEMCDRVAFCSDGRDEKDCPPLGINETMDLYSPGYPSPYPSNSDAKWVIAVEDGHVLRFEAVEFETEELVGTLTSRSMKTVTGMAVDVLLTFSGMKSGEVWYTESVSVVHFTSQYAFEGLVGFHIRVTVHVKNDTVPDEMCFYGTDCLYKASCDVLTSNECYLVTNSSHESLIVTPNYPLENPMSNFRWTILGPVGTRIKLFIEAAWLSERSIQIGHGQTQDSFIPLREYTGLLEGVELWSPDNTLLISYKKKYDFQSVHPRFIAHVTSVETADGDIRLIGTDQTSGRVEYYLNGEWGTVCDDYWDINDATVTCRQLGYQGALSATGVAHFGQGTGAIHLDDVECTGSEDTLSMCARSASHDCAHNEDAGVICSREKIEPPCSVVNETFNIPMDGVMRQSFDNNEACEWIGTYEMTPSAPDFFVIRVDINDLRGIDGDGSFIEVGARWNSENSSVIFRHSNIHLSFDYFLKRLNLRAEAFWIRIRQERLKVHMEFTISEEVNVHCPDTLFTCHDGNCIDESGVTNGMNDCPDGSDEHPRLGFRDCINSQAGFTTVNFTSSRDTCKRWRDIDLLRTRGIPENFCRIIPVLHPELFCIRDQEQYMAVDCYRHHCFDASCFYGNGSDYTGLAHFTENGFRCMQWQDVPSHLIVGSNFSGLQENFCRNVDEKSKPWCYYVSADYRIEWNYCEISQCTDTLIRLFRRVPKKYYFDTSNPFNQVGSYTFAYFTVEDCAKRCMDEELNIKCRSFVFQSGAAPYNNPECSWSSVTPHFKGELATAEDKEDYSIFIRIDTECEPFYLEDGLPENCALPVVLSSPFIGFNPDIPVDHRRNTYTYSKYGLNSCWRPENNSQPMELHFGERFLLTALVVSGCSDDELGWVTELSIESTQFLYRHVDADTGSHIFKANVEPRCSVLIPLKPRIWADYIRVVPVSYYISSAMKIDVLGCLDNDCDETLGMMNKAISDAAISGSSAADSEHSPAQSRPQLFGLQSPQTQGWIADSNDAMPYIQVEFRKLVVLRALVVQGCSPTGSRVTSFKLSYNDTRDQDSDASKRWVLQEGNGNTAIQVFEANVNSTSPVRIDLEREVLTTVVRIYPKTWHIEPCMKFEVIGCTYRACYSRLGMESFDILPYQLIRQGFCTSQDGGYRLHGLPDAGFSGTGIGEGTRGGSIGADLRYNHVISAIASQGVSAGYASHYFLRYQLAGESEGSWRTYRNIDGSQKTFSANSDTFTVVVNQLERPIVASKIVLDYGFSDDGSTYGFPCMRIELFGCKFDESGNICGPTAMEFEGSCFGAVQSDSPNACEDIFQPNSQPAIIKSAHLQNALREAFLGLELPNYIYYRIGITTETAQQTSGATGYIWSDGTPVVYNRFINGPPDSDGAVAENMCGFINSRRSVGWELHRCDSLEITSATLCQFDINECLQWDNQCSDECIDLPGTYSCTCRSGMYLEPTRQFNCESLCNIFSFESLENNTICVEHHSDVATWKDSEEICSQENALLISANRTLPQISHTATGRSFWISAPICEDNEVMCPLYTSDQDPVTCHDCSREFPFGCERGIPLSYELNCTDRNSQECLFDQTFDKEGFITWFGFPPWYQHMTSLRFHLTVEEGRKMRLRLISLRLRQRTQSQCLDSLTVQENFEHLQMLKGIYCGTLQNFDVDLHARNVTLTLEIGELSADMPAFLEMRAFFRGANCSIVDCESQCPSRPFTDPSGQIMSYNFPELLPIYFSCVWTVMTRPNTFIRVNFVTFDVSCGLLVPFEIGYWTDDDFLGQKSICGEEAGTIITDTNILAFRLRTDLAQESTGFNATYVEQSTPGCGVMPSSSKTCPAVTCTSPSAIIASRNYPLHYDEGLTCMWTITTSTGTFVELRFTDFDVPSSDPDCQGDSVELTSGLQKVRYCNENIEEYQWLYNSDRNEMTLRFKSNYDSLVGRFVGKYTEREFAPENITQGSGCDEEWVLINGECYHHFTLDNKLHWLDASAFCQTFGNGSYLATIRSQAEMDLIQQYILSVGDPTSGTYIGLMWDGFKERHVWDSGYPMSFTNWRVSGGYDFIQPDGGDLERCTVIQFWSFRETSNWNDVACAAQITNQLLCQQTENFSGVTMSVEELEITKEKQSCKDGQFHCASGECILSVFVCDGGLDCFDASDEKSCYIANDGDCGMFQFRCDDGSCIPSSFYCDFITHCTDGSDENQCNYPACLSDEFRCENSQCIKTSERCNLKDDCEDRSDERDCDWSFGNFQCFSGRILPSNRECDGYRDCSGKNWEDEPADCDYFLDDFSCNNATELQCTNGACADITSRCIMEYDEYGYLGGCRDVTHLLKCDAFLCPMDHFKCPASYCIPERYRCNGELDCPYGEDENFCESYNCAEGSYRCHGKEHTVCLPQREVCDGIIHCEEGDDEFYCHARCFDGCDCSGMSFNCSAVKIWRPEMAAKLPAKTKQLVLRDVISSNRKRRETEFNSSFVLIQDALYLDLHRFQFVVLVDFTGNGIEHILDGEFEDNMNLRRLILDNNQIQSISVKTFDGLNSLRYLSLVGNPLIKISNTPFAPLGSLEILDIQSTDVQDVSDEFFSGLTSLKELYSDKFFFCCLIAQSHELEKCLPVAGQFSSCKDLMKNRFLRISLWVLGTAAVIGNCFVIFLRVYRKEISRNSGRNPTQSILITNLAIADLLTGIYMLIIASADFRFRNVYFRYSEDWQTGGMCKFAGFLAVLGSECSVMFLTIITIDRFQGVVFPLSQRRLRFKSTYVLSACTWSFAFIVSFLPLLPFKYFGVSFYGRSSVCLALPLTRDFQPGWLYSVFLFLGFNFFCFLAMLVCYCIIYVKAKQSAGFKKLSTVENNNKIDEQIQMAAKMSFLVITDMVCWMPIIIMGTLATSGVAVIPGDIYAWTAVFILPINSALNPYLYTIFVKAAKRASSRSQKFSTTSTTSEGMSMSVMSAKPNASSKAQQDILQQVVNGFKRNRLVTSVNASTIQKITLSSMLRTDSFVLSKLNVDDIENDTKKGLQYLHDNGLVHGGISAESVIVDGEGDSEKRAFLVYETSLESYQKACDQNFPLEELQAKDRDDLSTVICSLRNRLLVDV